MRQSLAGSNQKIKPRRGKRIFMNDSIHDDLTAFPSAIFPEKHPTRRALASTLPGRSRDEKGALLQPSLHHKSSVDTTWRGRPHGLRKGWKDPPPEGTSAAGKYLKKRPENPTQRPDAQDSPRCLPRTAITL